MYKIKLSFVVAIFGALFFTGCSDKDLEVKPGSATDIASFFSDPTRAQQVLLASYNELGDFLGGNVPTVNELWSDNAFTTSVSVGGGLNYYEHTTGDLFNDSYNVAVMQNFGRTCRQANLAIYGCEKYGDKLDAATKQRITAEAKAVKGIAHFETVRLFGQPWGFTPDNSQLGIGIRKEYEEASVVRVSVKAVYDYAIAQLEEALPNLSAASGTANTMITRAAAKGYLARIYFQQNRYQDALDMATAALSESNITADSIQYRFSSDAHLAYNGSLLLFTATKLSTANTFKGFGLYGTYEYNAASKPIPAVMITEETANLVGASDSIRRAWFKSISTPDGAAYQLKKIPNNTTHFNFNALHWTELKLIKAECLAELNQLTPASTDLNDVREAHSLFPYSTATSAASLITNIRNQRRIEMVGEGNRVQDLKRIGAATRRGLTQAANNNILVRNAPWDCVGMVMQISSAEHAASPDFPFNPIGSCK